jgi:hypothetical protein
MRKLLVTWFGGGVVDSRSSIIEEEKKRTFLENVGRVSLTV